MNVDATWRTESSAARQAAAAAAMLLAGLALAVGLRHFEGPGLTPSLAGFLLGFLLLAGGAGMLLFGGKQVIVVDPRARRIVIEQAGRLRTSRREIRFDEISEVSVGELGDREGGRVRYCVVARLKTGKELSLFLGFFDGAHDRPAMEARCRRLADCLRARA